MKNFYVSGIALMLTFFAMSPIYSQIFISNLPIDMVAECSNVPIIGSPIANTDCTDGPATISLHEAEDVGMCPGHFTITRTWTATDPCGNTAIATQRISVEDSTPPVMESVVQDISVNCTAIPSMLTLVASDNCDGDLNLELFEFSSNTDCETGYTITRIWEATDHCGNKCTRSQFIHVQDDSVSTASEEVENLDKNVKLFPNPVKTQLQVSLANGLNVQQANLFDTKGNLLKTITGSEQLSPLNLEGFQQGVYILRLKTEAGIISKRFMVAG